MSDSTVSTKNSQARNVFAGALIALIAGALFGCLDAFISIDQMKATRFESSWASVPYRLFIGSAFYSQIFLGTWLCSVLLKVVLGIKSRRLFETSIIAWSLSSCAITAFCILLLIRLNRLLPSFRSPVSLAVNALVGICAVILLVVISRWGSKFHWKKKLPQMIILPATVFLELLFILVLATLSNAPEIAQANEQNAKTGSPNILLITIDTLRADHLSCYGYQGIHTKGIDSLAGQGVLFENALSPTSWTLPTFATLLTGVHQEVHGLNRHDVRLDPAFETVAETMKKAGYYTAAVVTNEFLNHPYNLDQGFDNYLFSGDAAAYHPLSGLLVYDFLFARTNERHNAENITTRAISLLKRVEKRPFFLWVHYIDPHTPYGAWYIDRFPDYDRNYKGKIGKEINELDGIEFSEDDKKHVLALYDAEIMYTDHNIERLLKAIDRLNLTGNTAVILTSDHGEEFWEHGDVLHGRTLYRESIHVPLVIRYPGKIPEQKRVDALATLIDLPTTILNIAGITPPSIYQGKDLFRYFSEDAVTKVFVSLDKLTPDKKRYASLGMYDPHWTFLKWKEPAKGEELFDMKNDPFQKMNVIINQENPAQDLRTALFDQLKESDDLKEGIKFVEKDSKIELTPSMREALRGLGYIN